ncbi:MAG: bile acid:sodium symporter family protein [Rubritalea sp.]|uniref:bile acid:sodium symporter family protein n=1 Tax=Rubritalea sp. TaxID=2109375 RepID=UPI0032424FE3
MFEKIVEVALPVALILVMIGVGMSLQIADFKRVAKFPKAFFIGAFCQLVFLPVLAYAIISAFGLTGALAMGVLVISLCPGGVTSNLFTYLAKGDIGLSVSLTAIIGIITPFTIPFVVNWGFEWQGMSNDGFVLPVAETVKKLLIISVLPVAIGMGVRRWAKGNIDKIEGLVRTGSSAVLALVILALYVKLGVSKVNEFAVLAGPACVVMNLVGMTLGFAVASLARLNRAQRTCIMLEVGLQNGTIALLVTTTILKSMEMSIAPSVYSLWMMVPATIVVLISKKRAKNQNGASVDSSDMELDTAH